MEQRNAGADFSSASSDFKALGAFFCNFVLLAARQPEWRTVSRRPCTTSWRVLTKDSPENRSFFGEGVKVVVEVVVDPQRQIDHFDDLGDDFRAAAEPCEKVADVAVVLFDGDGQVFAGEELVIRDELVITLPIIGDGES